jgi:hypothetical protein
MKPLGSNVYHIREAVIFHGAHENISRAALADGASGDRLASRSREAQEASETRADS